MFNNRLHQEKNPVLPRIIVDHLGSIRVVLNEQGNVDSWSDYYPFGKESRGSSTSNEPKEQFTGKERDNEIGLDYFGARYYNYDLGRWTSRDPLAVKFPSHSTYNYTLNNPINNYDPDGMETRFGTEDEAEKAKDALNKNDKLKGANFIVSKVKRTVKEGGFLGFFEKEVDKEFYILDIDPNSDFDFSQNDITSALYDAIKSTDVVFDVKITDKYYGDYRGGRGADISEGFGGGIIDPRKGGGTIWLSPKGGNNETMGVIFLHEMLGHGHPVGGKNATNINKYFNNRYEDGHAGYHEVIGWKKTGLFEIDKKKQSIKL